MMNKRKDQRRLTGLQGENLAAQYLIGQQYVIVERNWRCRAGELDIIAQKDDELIIIEVRARKTLDQFGHPIESVERRKQAQVRRLAEIYCSFNGKLNCKIRFDVITVLLSKDGTLQEINHYRNAF